MFSIQINTRRSLMETKSKRPGDEGHSTIVTGRTYDVREFVREDCIGRRDRYWEKYPHIKMQNHKIMTHENIELRCSSNFMGSLLKTSLVINFSSHVILMAFSPKQPGSVYHSFHNLFSNRLGQISFQIS